MAVPDPLDEREVSPDDIGPALRRARESAGFSIGDVAERMRLSRRHIEDLETDRFDLEVGSVFLRGYLTSYARLVGLDEGPLLDAYDRRGIGPPQLHSPENARPAARGSEFTVTITTIVVIAVLVILSALWWRDQWSEGDGLPEGLPAPTAAHPEEENAPRGEEGGPGEGAGSAHLDAGSGPEEAPGRDGAVVEPPDVEPSPAAEPSAAPDGEPAPDDDAGPAEGLPRGEEGPEEPADTTSGEEPEPPPDAPGSGEPDDAAQAGDPGLAEEEGGLASLVIRVREDCWLMIRDADQRLIYRDLASAGTVLDLAAAPPIRIVAGYAGGIEIEYDGEPFDLSPYVEADTGTARFRLGP